MLKKHLTQHKRLGGKLHAAFQSIIPDTYVLPAEYLEFTNAFSRRGDLLGEHNFWILKPAGLSRGRGISLVNDIADVTYGDSMVIQEYLHGK